MISLQYNHQLKYYVTFNRSINISFHRKKKPPRGISTATRHTEELDNKKGFCDFHSKWPTAGPQRPLFLAWSVG